jgi:uncharacterized protein YkwD
MKREYRFLYVLFGALILSSCGNGQQPKSKPFVILKPKADSSELVAAINNYRKQYKLPALPVSPSLTLVAEAHVKDLYENQPDKGLCNLHSWSDKGKWTPCCYTDDHNKAWCMWGKPREITSYKGNGYEIVAWASIDISVSLAMDLWKKSNGHNGMILNQGTWKNHPWKAMGVAIYKNYASVWFGELNE